MIAGVTRTLNGPRVIGQTLFKINETDFQSDISKIRVERPKALFVFAPGAMGISFLKQWAASGAGNDIKVYTIFMIDSSTLPAIGDAALGTFHVMQWSPDLENPANRKFVKDYLAKQGHMPSHWSAQSYDGARLIAAALRATGGKYEDGMALARALRKTPYESTRGAYTYNVNGMPIQNYYKREVIKDADGKLQIVNRGAVFTQRKDSHWEKCPPERRL
jgi:branched-chain amino acid transport system substrate-binding protein